jgi:perosamine synthetase
MITTNDEAIAEQSRVLRQHGMRVRYYHDQLGYNFRMTDIQAAIGLAQIKKLGQFNAARIRNAQFFNDNLCGVGLPTVPENYTHVFHQYTIRVGSQRRDAMVEALHEKGIGTGVFYPVPVHQQSFYRQELGYAVSLPQAEKAASEVLSLPVHPGLSNEDRLAIVKAVNEFTA